MSGVSVHFGGVGTAYSLLVKSTSTRLPPRPPTAMPLRPTDQVFVDLEVLVSDPKVDTPCVVNAGDALFDAMNAFPNTQTALNLALATAPQSPDRNLRIHVPDWDDTIRHLPWESLRDTGQNSFLDCDLGLPVVRVIEPKPNATEPNPAVHGDGLRVFSVIAAEGLSQDGASELKALLRALDTYGNSWSLQVYSPDQPVIDVIAARADVRVTHHHVPRTASDLMNSITACKPQICHLFCHGLAMPNGPARLELSSRGSMAGGATVSVQASQLAAALPSSAWLVLLNACNSGASPGDSGSLATALVEDGVPVVIGMREPTQSRTLHALTEAFLQDALGRIASALAQPARTVLDLSPSITAARQAICARFRQNSGDPAQRMKDWTLPAMFVSARGFEVEPTADNEGISAVIAELESKQATLRMFLDWAESQVSPDHRSQIEAAIKEIETEIGRLRT